MYKIFDRLEKYKKRKYIQLYIVFGLLLSGNTFVCNATEQYFIQLPSMNAAAALDKLAGISGYSLIYPFNDSIIIMTNPLFGTYTVPDALEKLLVNTSLNAIATKKRVIAVSSTLNNDINHAKKFDNNIIINLL